jgi:hypothetical protein
MNDLIFTEEYGTCTECGETLCMCGLCHNCQEVEETEVEV